MLAAAWSAPGAIRRVRATAGAKTPRIVGVNMLSPARFSGIKADFSWPPVPAGSPEQLLFGQAMNVGNQILDLCIFQLPLVGRHPALSLGNDLGQLRV